jgi:uncharacterized protein (TIGR00730 family)
VPLEPPLAYADPRFLDSDDARAVRILSEYLAPLAAFARERVHDTVVFFGSARAREGDASMGKYYDDARRLASLVTQWAQTFPEGRHRLVVCTGGGGGFMEAANRGAAEAGGCTIGLNIALPHEQSINAYVSSDLAFQFHYFFMRKLWFAHLARAFVAFPGGFGTFDELFEMLTLAQTRKLDRRIPVVLYGSSFWREVVDFEALARHGLIAAEDLKLFDFADDPDAALEILKQRIVLEQAEPTPAIAKSATRCVPDHPPEGAQS